MISLKDLIIEAVSTTFIFEMAYSREKYINEVHSLTDQIVQNWCLIKYCNLYDIENENRLHWSKELIAHISNLQRMKLKGGINKYRTTKYSFIERDEINNINNVEQIIVLKFEEEHINTNLMEIAIEFVNSLDTIIDIISNKTLQELKNYVHNQI